MPTHEANLEKWIVQVDRLFNSHYLGQLLQLANEKQSFPTSARRKFIVVFDKSSSNKYCNGQFTITIGHGQSASPPVLSMSLWIIKLKV